MYVYSQRISMSWQISLRTTFGAISNHLKSIDSSVVFFQSSRKICDILREIKSIKQKSKYTSDKNYVSSHINVNEGSHVSIK